MDKHAGPHLAIPDLHADEDVATTDFEKATLLAKYFASQCTSTAPQEHLKGAPFPLPENSVAKPFPSNCGSLDLFFADFSMILRILSPIFSQQKKRKKKRRDVREKTMQRKRCRENDAGISRSYHFTKKSVIPVLEPPFFPTKLFYGHTRDRKMTWRQERASYAGRYSRYHCFTVHDFAGKTVVCGSSKIHH